MFPLQHGKEMLIQFSSTPQKKEETMMEDLVLERHNHCWDDSISKNFVRKRQWTHQGFDDGSNDRKKMMHRDIERQRRHAMSTLHVSLAALLPYEFIKGKRSISDHVDGTVSYIKQLQKNIKEQSGKRDELKKVYKYSRPEDHVDCSLNSSFVIHEICEGEKTERRSTRYVEEGLPLSRVLTDLLEQGLDVVSCISTSVNGRLLHTIQYKAGSSTSIDPSMLEGKLVKLETSKSGIHVFE